jgi:hypothetical protein
MVKRNRPPKNYCPVCDRPVQAHPGIKSVIQLEIISTGQLVYGHRDCVEGELA